MTDADREAIEYLASAMDRLADAIRELAAESRAERLNRQRPTPARGHRQQTVEVGGNQNGGEHG